MSWKGCRTMLAAANRSTASELKSPKVSILARSLKVMPALNEFVDAPKVSRGHTIKKIWEYIKLHNLQNPTNRRQIICDAKLKTIFSGKDAVGMFEIANLINPHFIKDN